MHTQIIEGKKKKKEKTEKKTMGRGARKGATSKRTTRMTLRGLRGATQEPSSSLAEVTGSNTTDHHRSASQRGPSSFIQNVKKHELPSDKASQRTWYRRDVRLPLRSQRRGLVHGGQARNGQDMSTEANKKGTTTFRDPRITNRTSTVSKLRKQTVRQPKNHGRTGITNPWDFDSCIRQLFSKISESNMKRVRWEGVSKELGDSLMLIIRGNMRAATSQVFNESTDELNLKLKSDDAKLWMSEEKRKEAVHRILHGKRKMMEEIVDKIEGKLLESKLPGRVSSDIFDVESIVKRRELIQSHYKRVQKEVERLELELQMEREKLTEAETFIRSQRNTRERTTKGRLFGDNLHPKAYKEVQNNPITANGSGSEQKNGTSCLYQKDKVKFNLVLRKGNKVFENRPDGQKIEEDILLELLPSLRTCNSVLQSLHKSASNLLKEETDTTDHTDI